MLGAPSRLIPWSTANRIAAEGSPSSLLRLSCSAQQDPHPHPQHEPDDRARYDPGDRMPSPDETAGDGAEDQPGPADEQKHKHQLWSGELDLDVGHARARVRPPWSPAADRWARSAVPPSRVSRSAPRTSPSGTRAMIDSIPTPRQPATHA